MMSTAMAMARIGSKKVDAGELHEQQADGNAERGVDVGEQVRGVGLESRRVGAPRDGTQLRDTPRLTPAETA